ncbi:MAG: ArsC family reductase [Porticoccaceae bacterium]|jgi:Spx/MgsR family transcriptional regulator
MILYGISNCDTVKKAKSWLEENNLDYHFHDFRKQGLESAIIQDWLSQIDWQKLLNKRSTTWRNLDAKTQQSVNAENIIQLLVENPTLIKRPVLKVNGIINIGFNADTYQGIFN